MNDTRNEKPITIKRLNILGLGSALLIVFLLSLVVLSFGLVMQLSSQGIKEVITDYWGWIVAIILIENIIFWSGIILVYMTSVQLGVKLRVLGLICGWMPIIHLIVLTIIIRITTSEVLFEKSKIKLNRRRAAEQICKTRYPILMVHGVFFRDFKYFNYWGRVPAELEKNGATIYYGNHESAASVTNSAKELAARIREIVETTGCGKVNIIAHSKGGLDVKTAVVQEGIYPYVASITTINTPHHGCEFAEYLLNKAPAGMKEKVAGMYNGALKRVGDKNPDFIAAVTDLTASRCKEIWDYTCRFDYRAAGVYTQSVGSCMKKATSGAFPLNMSYHLVGHFDGPNDGLVGEPSFRWGENYTFLQNKKKRGISHGDMIDLNRQNIPGFDIREFFVQLVADLKRRGM
ncbi:MAG: triacylglycerol lipase [Eubacterium sp.]|nr:triacylglycerol lipase [Eubacterium sp.]